MTRKPTFHKVKIGPKKFSLARREKDEFRTILTFAAEQECDKVLGMIKDPPEAQDDYEALQHGRAWWLVRTLLGGKSLVGVATASSQEDLDDILSRLESA